MARILYIGGIDSRRPDTAPEAIRPGRVAAGLAALGHRVTVLCGSAIDLPAHVEPPIEIRRAPLPGRGVWAHRFLAWHARRLAGSGRWDLICCRHPRVSILLARSGISHLFETDRLDPAECHRGVLRSPLVTRVLATDDRLIERLVEAGVDTRKLVRTGNAGEVTRILDEMTRVTPVRRRVLHILNSFHPLFGGAERQALALARAQATAGDRVTVLTRRRAGLPPLDGVGPVAIHRVGLPVLGGVGFLLAGLGWVTARRHAIDLIHAHQARTPAVIAILARPLTTAPVLVKLAGQDAPLGHGIGSRVRRHALRAADRVVAVNDTLADICRRLGVKRLTVIPNAVDTERYAPGDHRRLCRRRLEVDEDTLLVIYVGRFEQVKGVDVLLAAWERVRALVPGARLRLTGDGSERATLAAAAPAGVELAPPVEDPLFLYQAADLLVVPSRSEGLANVLLEGMACALPVVTTRVGGHPALIEDGLHGRLAPPDDPEALASVMIEVLCLPIEERRRMGAAARARVAGTYGLAACERAWAALGTAAAAGAISNSRNNISSRSQK